MRKKKYQTPKMRTVEFEVEQHLLTASTETYTLGNAYGDGDFE